MLNEKKITSQWQCVRFLGIFWGISIKILVVCIMKKY